MAHLGIDFGTTNSVVAHLLEEPTRVRVGVVRSAFGEERFASAVALSRDGRWLFGRAAKEAAAGDQVLSVKRLLGGEERVGLDGRLQRPEAVAALLFRHLLTTAEAQLGEPLESAVVTVPANSKGLQRSATKIAAAAAGLRVLNLINEPTAAALAYGLGPAAAGRDLRVLVYDFGGGTFDVTVLRAHHGIFEELASRGLRHCGGDDLDLALAQQLVTAELPAHDADLTAPHPALRLRLACEDAKIRLSDVAETRVDLEDLRPGVHLHATVTRDQLEDLARPLLRRTADPVRDALAEAGLLPSELDHVLLVGGTSLMPAVRGFVEDLLGRPAEPFEQADPLTCVAQGAAIVAGILGGCRHLANLDYQVCLEHALCTEVVDPHTGRRFLQPVIEQGTKIPNRNTRVYLPVADFSAEVLVSIWEGNALDQPNHEENVRLGEVRVPLDPPRPSEDCPIEVQFAYSEDGLLTATARDIRVDRTFSEVIDFQHGLLAEAEQTAIRELLTTVFGTPPRAVAAGSAGRPSSGPALVELPAIAEARQRLATAEAVLAKADAAETTLLRSLRDELTAVLDAGAAPDEVATVDRRLAAELLFFDYLL